MHKLWAYISFTLLLFATGCTPDPSACILVNDDDPLLSGSPVQFYNCSFDAETYEWKFGDAATATTREPAHTYSQPGNYTVTLTAGTKNGKNSSLVTKSVTICDTSTNAYWGTYQVAANCDVGAPFYPIVITPTIHNNQIIIQNFANHGRNILAFIDGNSLTIYNQTSIDGVTVEGNGILNGNDITMSYITFSGSNQFNCTAVATKQ